MSVEITFDCLPLRSVTRLDIPLDASPGFRAKCERIKQALAKHGLHNTYYLHNAQCVFRLTNNPEVGMLQFRFEGTVFTDTVDRQTQRCDLAIELARETCDWLTEPAVRWLADCVSHAVSEEFDRYIAAGDLDKTLARLAALEAATLEKGGFVGMGL